MDDNEFREPTRDEVNLAAWHIEQLIQGGFDTSFAGRLAVLEREEIERAVELLAAGCPQALIEEILA